MKKKPSPKPKRQKAGGKKGKKKYKVRNWKEYNQALVDRGKILFWITEEAMKNWENQKKTGKRGKPKQFSNTAIQTALHPPAGISPAPASHRGILGKHSCKDSP